MQIVTRLFDDWHVHLRRLAILRAVALYTARYCDRALIMPNTDPPILTGADCKEYREEILSATRRRVPSFKPLMTIKIIQSTKPEWIYAAHEAGAIAGKIYPAGVTNNAEDGVSDFEEIAPVLEAMQEVDMVAPIHGEQPDEFCTDREKLFLPTVEWLCKTFPRLRIVLEHVTTREAVALVKSLPDTVAATITAHHLWLTRDDLIGRYMQPHNFCLPEAKRPEDQEALREAATSGNPKFFFGSDSAPHPCANKECAKGKPGVFTAPVAPQLLAQVFEKAETLNRLQAFTSEFGARFYGLPLNEGTMIFEKKPFTVPQAIDGIVPFMAGETLPWSIKTE